MWKSISRVFNYCPRRHVLLKDKKTDSQIKKHVLSLQVGKGWIQDSDLVVSVTTIHCINCTTAVICFVQHPQPAAARRSLPILWNALLPDCNQSLNLSSPLPGQWRVGPGLPIMVPWATQPQQAMRALPPDRHLPLSCCFQVICLLLMLELIKVPNQDLSLIFV